MIPDNSLGFGFTIPFKNESTTDMYFTIRADDSASWAAVGIGSHEMEGALIFVIYSSADGNSVTCSPRPSRADIEPAHDSSLNVETLESHIQDGKMYFSGKCTNCRNWKGGYLDVTSQTAKGIYAMGPKGSTLSDDKSAGIRYHTSYGSFNIDMNHATGTGNAPVIDDNTSAFGAELYEDDQESGKRDLKSTFHAFVMILTFIGLMPGGVAILRFGNSVRFHWINQSLAVLSVIIGLGLGIYDSLYYQRVRLCMCWKKTVGRKLTEFGRRADSKQPIKSLGSLSWASFWASRSLASFTIVPTNTRSAPPRWHPFTCG